MKDEMSLNRETTDKSLSLLSDLGIAYWEYTSDKGYYHSPEYEKYAISEMADDKIWDPEAPFAYVHPDDVEKMKRFMQQYDDDKIQKSAVVRCKMNDGSYRWTEMFSFAELSADGKLHRLVSAMRDVDKEWIASLLIEEKNKELNHIIESMSGGVATCVIHDGYKMVSVTGSILKRLGYEADDLLVLREMDSLKLIHPSDRKLVVDRIDSVVKTKQSATIAYRILMKDGNYKWFRVSFYDAGETDGYPTVYEVLTDIAELNANYEDALNQTNDIVMVSDWESRDLLYVNEAASKHAHIPISDLLGRKCSMIGSHSDTECAHCKKSKLSYDELLEGIEKVGDTYFLTKGKRTLWNGREAFVEYVSDVTAEQHMKEKVVFDRNLLSAATKILFPMCIISNLTKNTYEIVEYEDFNTKKADTSGCFDELIEVGASTIPEEDRDAFVKAFSRENLLRAHACGTKMIPLTHRQMGDDGKVHWNHTTVVFADQLFNGDLYSITFTYNVDEQKQAEAAVKTALADAEKANVAKTAFLSRVSHDMRTPLNGILGLTNILKNRTQDEKDRHDLTELEFSGQYLLNLINDTLDVSRIENGKLTLNPSVFDCKDIVDSAIRLIKTNAKPKKIHINADTASVKRRYLYVDNARLEQVIMNVVGNAIKFSPEGGDIDITIEELEAKDGMVHAYFKVRDYGVGMSAEFLPHIFEAFSQEDNKLTSSTQGTGLGMAITKQLLQLMGGDIMVESELGKGSCFTIELNMPIATPEQISEYKKENEKPEVAIELSGKRVLLCEDHPLNTKIATQLLEVKGMIVDHAENGEVAVETFASSAEAYYDVVLMDIRMPVMNGIDATKAIRKLERADAKTVPIIAMTANAFEDDVKNCFSAGMNAHISKPIEPAIMYETIAKYLPAD